MFIRLVNVHFFTGLLVPRRNSKRFQVVSCAECAVNWLCVKLQPLFSHFNSNWSLRRAEELKSKKVDHMSRGKGWNSKSCCIYSYWGKLINMSHVTKCLHGIFLANRAIEKPYKATSQHPRWQKLLLQQYPRVRFFPNNFEIECNTVPFS